MTNQVAREDVQICRGFTVKQWEGLRPQLESDHPAAWTCAIEVFERRIRERFLSSIDSLVEADSQLDVCTPMAPPPDCSTLPDDGGTPVVVPGFAITGVCCLLIETLQSFREGGESTTDRFKRFLRRPSFRNAFDDDKVATSFVRGVRNGILHNAETRGWMIWREDPPNQIVTSQGDRFILNRAEFYSAVRAEFEQYLAELRNGANEVLRSRFVEKMGDIAARS